MRNNENDNSSNSHEPFYLLLDDVCTVLVPKHIGDCKRTLCVLVGGV